MVRIFPAAPDLPGKITLAVESSLCVDVYYTPSQEKLTLFRTSFRKEPSHPIKILRIDSDTGSLTMWPFDIRESHDEFLGPKYEQVKRITLADAPLVRITEHSRTPSANEVLVAPYFGPTKLVESSKLEEDMRYVPTTPEEVMEILEDLPPGFTKNYDYGLGLAHPYRFIVDAVQRLSDSTEIVVSPDVVTRRDDATGRFFISFADFEKARKSINNATTLARKAAQSINSATVHNLLANQVGGEEMLISAGRHPLRKLFTRAAQGETALTGEEHSALLETVSRNAAVIAESAPLQLSKLRNDIELVTLEQLIDRFETMIEKTLKEKLWQAFLGENPFVLELAFGYPVVIVCDQAFVGGRKFDGSDDKITDFLVKNSMTNNTAIVEIKTPQTRLLNKKTYRGVYVASSKLTGAISQVLDQKWRLHRNIDQRKLDSRVYDIESYAIHCCLIVGVMPENGEQIRSFEMIREDSKSVSIVTFDELLTKLRNLHRVLATGELGQRTPIAEEDLPF